VDGASRKSNPSFDWYQKTRKPEKPEKPGNQNKYLKYQSRFTQVKFQGGKLEIFEI
jgi:hypothetical protein